MKTNQNLSRLEGKSRTINKSHFESLNKVILNLFQNLSFGNDETLNQVQGDEGSSQKSHAERVGGAPRTSASSTHVVSQGQQQRQALKTLKQVQGDFINKKAFTLIELLVVVLIIGILAAVVLPQYNKAVWRARLIQAKIMAQTIAHAQEVYYMANGQYSTSFKELDISVPTDDIRLGKYAYFPWGMCELYTKTTNNLNEIVCRISAHGDSYLSYQLVFEHNDSNAGRKVCVAYSKDESAINYQVCANETKKRKGVSWSSNATGFVYP